MFDATPKPLRIQIMASDGRELLSLTETPDGKLDVTGDPADYTEAAQRFIDEMTRLSAL